jgi:hypothetical protein
LAGEAAEPARETLRRGPKIGGRADFRYATTVWINVTDLRFGLAAGGILIFMIGQSLLYRPK